MAMSLLGNVSSIANNFKEKADHFVSDLIDKVDHFLVEMQRQRLEEDLFYLEQGMIMPQAPQHDTMGMTLVPTPIPFDPKSETGQKLIQHGREALERFNAAYPPQPTAQPVSAL